MKIASLGLTLALSWTTSALAQTDSTSARSAQIETKSSAISSDLVAPSLQRQEHELPDAPIPILPSRQDGPMPCPAGVGRPCALLGGRLYFSDPSHMTEHDKSWVAALRNPMILTGLLVNLGADVWDYRSTRACMANHTCREGNPLMGQSRAQQLSVGLSLDATFYFLAAKLKQRGSGNYAFFCLAANSTLHFYYAAHGHALASSK